MAIKEIVLELVLVAAEASIAGSVAFLWAILQNTQRVLEYDQSEAADPLSESRSAWQCVV